MTPPILAGIMVAALLTGVLMILFGLGRTTGPAGPPSAGDVWFRRLTGADLPPPERRRRLFFLVVAAVGLAVGWLYSGIPTVGLLVAVAVITGPWLFGAGRAERKMLARLEAVEVWTRRLADLVRAGGGLHQAIMVSAPDAPLAIRPEVMQLASELGTDMTTWDALHRLADRLGDVTSDEVIAALMLNAKERGPRLADVLDRVSEAIADLVTSRREISASRTDARLTGNILTVMTLGGMLLLLLNRGYMQPYHSTLGQMVFVACVLGLAAILAWMRALNTPPRVPRLLARSSVTEEDRP